MIQTGDRFSARDLRQSVDEVVGAGLGAHIAHDKKGALFALADIVFDMLECTPDGYATKMIECYDDIKSSAVNLDKQLRDNGYRTTHKFSYDYFVPGFTSEQIVRDAYRLEYFKNLSSMVRARAGHKKEFEQIFQDAFRVSYYYAQYLWACNSRVCAKIAQELTCPGYENWGQIIGAILGVGFKFHPNDVYEFAIKHTNPNLSPDAFNARYIEQLNFKDLLMTDYGIDTGCLVLSPESRDKLTRIVTHTDSPYLIQVLRRALGVKSH